MNKSILFISYAFPPVGGAGVQRTAKFVKYFARNGWEVHVLTTRYPSVPVVDRSLLEDIPSNVTIHKALALEVPYRFKKKIWGVLKWKSKQKRKTTKTIEQKPSKSIINDIITGIFLPDYQIGWLPFAKKKAKSIIHNHNINYVFISAPPFSPFLMTEFLKRNTSIKKVVLDFRDEWTEFYLKSYTFHKKIKSQAEKIEKMEENAIHSADLIVMATRGFARNYKSKYPKYASKIKVITNGFDPDDFNDIKKGSYNNQKFNIVYTGTIFNVTTARFFLEALEELLHSDEKLSKKIQVNIAGRITPDEQVFFDQFKYPEVLNYLGYLSHSESIQHLYKADLLLVIVDDLQGSDRIIAAKIFEYINVKKPILALVPVKGEIANIILETQSGIVISNRDIVKIKTTLFDLVNNNLSIIPSGNEIDKYSRPNLSLKLMDYISNSE